MLSICYLANNCGFFVHFGDILYVLTVTTILPAFIAQSLRQIKGKTRDIPTLFTGSQGHWQASLFSTLWHLSVNVSYTIPQDIYSSLKGVRSQAWWCIPFITALRGSEIYILISRPVSVKWCHLVPDKQARKQANNKPNNKNEQKVSLLCFYGSRSLR